MASINKVILVGNLGRDPETRYTADGSTAITALNLATTRRYRDSSGQTVSETEWHRVTLFSRLAEVAKDYARKGSLIYVEGRLRTRRYTDKDGIERYVTEIIGEQLQLLDRRNSDQQNVDDGFESAPRPQPRTAAPAAPASHSTPAAAPSAGGIDALEEDVPF
ncbi:MAG: single-stranded DNA-binding protein [Sutterella sp.]|nr:single-stranded DNA-binding protein [Sutterella sp.]